MKDLFNALIIIIKLVFLFVFLMCLMDKRNRVSII